MLEDITDRASLCLLLSSDQMAPSQQQEGWFRSPGSVSLMPLATNEAGFDFQRYPQIAGATEHEGPSLVPAEDR